MFNNGKIKELEYKISVLNTHIGDLENFQKEFDEKFNRYKRIQEYGEKMGATVNVTCPIKFIGKKSFDLYLYKDDKEYQFKDFIVDSVHAVIISKKYRIAEYSPNMIFVSLFSIYGDYKLNYLFDIEAMDFFKVDLNKDLITVPFELKTMKGESENDVQ